MKIRTILVFALVLLLPLLTCCTPRENTSENGINAPPVTAIERVKALEDEARAALNTLPFFVRTSFSAPGLAAEEARVTIDGDSFSLEKIDTQGFVSIIYTDGTAYIKSNVDGTENKAARTLTKLEAKVLLYDMVCGGIDLSVSDFESAVIYGQEDKITAYCMKIKPLSAENVLSSVDYNLNFTEINSAEYSFTVGDGKYDKIEFSILYTSTNEGVANSFFMGFKADFGYGLEYSVTAPDDADTYAQE